MRKVNRIVIHCTATPQDRTVEKIKKYWKEKLKWKHPGYHAIISADGLVHWMVSSFDQITNGVKGYNKDSIHIAYIGGMNGDDRTDEQKAQMKILIEQLRSPNRFGNIPVVGHRDLSPDLDGDGVIERHEWVKRCPSFEVSKWLKYEGID